MITAAVQQETSQGSRPQIPPSVLLVGKKRPLDYVTPALYRINNTSELIIKATGSLSIVTAIDLAEIVKRGVVDIATQSITVGTDELRIATGELKRMSCIVIRLIKVCPIAVGAPPSIDMYAPVENEAQSAIEIPIEETDPNVMVGVPGDAVEKAKRPRAKGKSSSAAKKKSSKTKKKKLAQ
jgi:DNA-binding protein Alba